MKGDGGSRYGRGWGSSMPASQQDCNRGIAETKDQNTFACRTITQSQTWNMCLYAGYNSDVAKKLALKSSQVIIR